MNKYLPRLLITLLFPVLITASQHPEKNKQQSNHRKTVLKSHYFMVGGAFVDNNDVNHRMKQMGYTEFTRYGLSVGFGWNRRFRKFISGGEFEGLFWKRNHYKKHESVFGAGRVLALYGVSLFQSKTYSLYPLFGLGGGVSHLRAGPSELPFDSAFVLPSQVPTMSSLYQFAFLLDFGMGAEIKRPLPRGKPGNVTIGLRLGYLLNPVEKNKWHRSGVTIRNGPFSNLSGPYLRLTLGSTGVKRKKECCAYHKEQCHKKCPSESTAK